MVPFFCSSSLTKMNLNAYVILFFASRLFQDCSSQVPVIITYSSKPSEVLRCNISSNTAFVAWTEVASNGSTLATIFEYNRTNGFTTKSPPTEAKYINFLYQLNEDISFDLVIGNVTKDDGGNYRCVQISPLKTTEYQVEVEALPLSITIICSSSATCDETNGMPGTNVNCTCTAFEVFPGSLQLEWSDALHMAGQTHVTEAGDYFDLTSRATVNPTEASDEVTCSVKGYQSEEIEGTVNVTYKFAPPQCTLLIDCFSTTVTCNCRGQSPPDITYVFYNQSMQSIGTSNNTQMDVADYIELGKTNSFSCRGCNGINFGVRSIAINTTDCPTSLTTEPPSTTAKSTTNGEDDGDKPPILVGSIITGCIAILLVVIVGVVYCFRVKNREQGRGGRITVAASTDDTTSSAPPLYGVVDKSKKKKSDNTDDSGASSKPADQPAYAIVTKL